MEDLKQSGIYCITNLINDKKYIGMSKNICNRWKQHKYSSYRKGKQKKVLYQAFQKYGIDNFKFEVLEFCKEEDLQEREMYYINKYNTFLKGYNSTIGGEGIKKDYGFRWWLENKQPRWVFGNKLFVDKEEMKSYMQDRIDYYDEETFGLMLKSIKRTCLNNGYYEKFDKYNEKHKELLDEQTKMNSREILETLLERQALGEYDEDLKQEINNSFESFKELNGYNGDFYVPLGDYLDCDEFGNDFNWEDF